VTSFAASECVAETWPMSSKLSLSYMLAGLPDGFFSNPKFQFGQILEGPRWENVDLFYNDLEYFTDIWDIL
jgi:hypothetical protein